METKPVAAYGRSFGVSDSEPFPFGYESSRTAKGAPRVDTLPIIDHRGQRVGSLSPRLLPGRLRDAGLVPGSVAPDGRMLAAIGFTYLKQVGGSVTHATVLSFIDIRDRRVAHEYAYRESEYAYRDDEHTSLSLASLGWRDNSTLLVRWDEQHLKANPDPDGPDYVAMHNRAVVAVNAETGE